MSQHNKLLNRGAPLATAAAVLAYAWSPFFSSPHSEPIGTDVSLPPVPGKVAKATAIEPLQRIEQPRAHWFGGRAFDDSIQMNAKFAVKKPGVYVVFKQPVGWSERTGQIKIEVPKAYGAYADALSTNETKQIIATGDKRIPCEFAYVGRRSEVVVRYYGQHPRKDSLPLEEKVVSGRQIG